MGKEFSLERIKSILEFNLRKARVKGFEYIDNDPSTTPDGLSNLKSDSSLTSWKAGDKIEIPSSPTKYALKDNNLNLRDAIAKTIYNILSGSTSTNSFTAADESNYLTNPSNGNDNDDGDGLYLEVPAGKKITLKVGNTTFEISNTGINIT